MPPRSQCDGIHCWWPGGLPSPGSGIRATPRRPAANSGRAARPAVTPAPNGCRCISTLGPPGLPLPLQQPPQRRVQDDYLGPEAGVEAHSGARRSLSSPPGEPPRLQARRQAPKFSISLSADPSDHIQVTCWWSASKCSSAGRRLVSGAAPTDSAPTPSPNVTSSTQHRDLAGRGGPRWSCRGLRPGSNSDRGTQADNIDFRTVSRAQRRHGALHRLPPGQNRVNTGVPYWPP